MALITETQARAAASRRIRALNKSVTTVLKEEASTSATSFDIFLSHSRVDAELVLGVKQILAEAGKSVYIDWVDDPQLDRSNVTTKTAEHLRVRMGQCSALFYVHSGNAAKSRWMPWELGYFDGGNGNVAIVPVLTQGSTEFAGEEYLGLYPYVDITESVIGGARNVWINKSVGKFATLGKFRI